MNGQCGAERDSEQHGGSEEYVSGGLCRLDVDAFAGSGPTGGGDGSPADVIGGVLNGISQAGYHVGAPSVTAEEQHGSGHRCRSNGRQGSVEGTRCSGSRNANPDEDRQGIGTAADNHGSRQPQPMFLPDRIYSVQEAAAVVCVQAAVRGWLCRQVQPWKFVLVSVQCCM